MIIHRYKIEASEPVESCTWWGVRGLRVSVLWGVPQFERRARLFLAALYYFYCYDYHYCHYTTKVAIVTTRRRAALLLASTP